MIKELSSFIEYDASCRLNALITVSGHSTDGSFAIHHFLSTFVKNGHRVVFLSLAQPFGHFQAVAQKLGANLSLAKTDGQLSHIDGLSFSLQAHHDDDGNTSILTRCARCKSLRPLYDEVATLISSHTSSHPSSTLSVVIDNVSVLLSLGFAIEQLSEFVHYIQVDLKKISGNFVALVHKDGNSEDLANTLAYQADVLIFVEGLASGHSKDVHGQLTVTSRDSRLGTRRPRHVHYKARRKIEIARQLNTARPYHVHFLTPLTTQKAKRSFSQLQVPPVLRKAQ